MKLEKLINEYLKICEFHNKLDCKTIKAYKLDLKQFVLFASKATCFYDKSMIVEYIFFLNNKYSKVKTVKRKIASLKAFFSYLSYEDIIDINPFYKIKLKLKEPLILPKTIPVESLRLLFQFVYNEKNKLDKKSYKYKEIIRDILILEILLGTGIRISELCNLKKIDINGSDKTIKIFGKGAKERIIPIYDENIWHLVKQYENLFLDSLVNSEYFFVNRLGNILSSQSVRNMIKKYSIKAEIYEKISPHMFRHTFATMLLENDVDIRYIQQLLGHSNITTTEIYTHITSNKKSEIMRDKNPRSKIVVDKG